MFNPLSFSFRVAFNSSLLTVVLRFLFLYRFQGSVLSRGLCSRASLYIIPPLIEFVNTFFENFSIFFAFLFSRTLFHLIHVDRSYLFCISTIYEKESFGFSISFFVPFPHFVCSVPVTFRIFF